MEKVGEAEEEEISKSDLMDAISLLPTICEPGQEGTVAIAA